MQIQMTPLSAGPPPKKVRLGLWKLIGGHYVELLILSAFLNLMILAVPIFVLQVYDRVVAQQGLTTLAGLVMGMGVVLLFDFIFRKARSRLMQRAALKVEVDLNKRVYNKITALPLRTLESRPPAAWTSTFRDIDAVRNSLGGAGAVLIADLPFALVFLAFVWVIATPVAWVLTAMLPIFVLLTLISSSRLNKLNFSEREAGFKREMVLGDLMQGRQTIKALHMGPVLKERWEAATVDTVSAALDRGRATDGYSFVGSSLAMFTTIVLTTVGALAILNQEMTIGALIAANILASRTIQPFTQLVSGWRNFAMSKQAASRLEELLSLPEEVGDDSITLDRPQGEYKLEDLRFAFLPGAAPAVEGVNVTILPGGLHAVVGRNGSGKTTLLKLMSGLYAPQAGRVLIDGIDIAQVSRRQLSDWIGFVPLEVDFFHGSISENISFGKAGGASDDEVIAAARDMGAHDAIVDLPDGYNTIIGEGGVSLSAGQAQRIALARAVVGDPPILLLDEPTSKLDSDTERVVAEALKTRADTKMVIVVTHSPGLIKLCDDVIVLERGRAVAAGPVDQILRKDGGLRPAPRLVDSGEGETPVDGGGGS